MIRLWCSLFHRKHHHRVGRVSMECSVWLIMEKLHAGDRLLCNKVRRGCGCHACPDVPIGTLAET